MKKKQVKRIVSAVLIIVLLVTYFPVLSFANSRFSITSGGEVMSRVEIYKHERLEVRAENMPEGTSAQWQIRIPDTEIWVDIQGETSDTIDLSYAILGSLMEDGSAYVRCAAISGGEEVDHTDPLRATITEKEKETVSPAAPPKEIRPAEPAPVKPTEEPAEVPTEAPVEEPVETPTEAPVEEPTEALVETPTEAPAEVPTEAPAEAPTEIPAEVPTEVPVEIPTEIPAGEPTETAVEVIEEVPAETAVQETVQEEESRPVVYVGAEPLSETEPAEEMPIADDTVELVSITVQYVYRDHHNQPVDGFDWPPYVANIAKGEDYKTTVQIKTIPGYRADLEATSDNVTLSVDKRTITFNLENVTESKIYTVIYKADEVDYHARRFMQNVNNDLYTEDIRFVNEIFKGYPGDLPNTDAIYRESDYPGFTALFYQPDTIAADGSTVFEVYYDRNYYLINFDLDGGHGVSPIYARYETAFHVQQPSKAGYTFAGWELISGETGETDDMKVGDVVQDLSGTVPATNQKYKARWTNADTTYMVMYWLEDANSNAYLYHGSSEKIPAQTGEHVSAVTYKDAAEFGDIDFYVLYDEEKTLAEEAQQEHLADDGKVIVQGDGTTILNVYYKRKEYNLKFYYAMTAETTDLTNYPDGHKYIYVIGGSTWKFGGDAVAEIDRNNDLALLNWYMSTGSGRGTIKALPQLTEEGQKKGYTMGTEKQNVNGTDYLYYYLQFSAKYGQIIEDKWPIDVFGSVTRADMSSQPSGWASDLAYASAWNGEYNVRYSRKDNNGNQTIKGKYQKLDYRILWENPTTGQKMDPSDMTVSYMCFWENGADIGWSVPDLFYYRLWVPLLKYTRADGTFYYEEFDGETTEYNGVKYRLYERYATCDNSSVGEQTAVSLEGYDASPSEGGTPPVRDGVGGSNGESGANQAKQILREYGYTDEMFATYRRWFVVDFYYTRNQPKKLRYYNVSGYMQGGGGAVVEYGKPLAMYGAYFSKEIMERDYYPDLEPNAYEFEGWYTSRECIPGTEMDWTQTMPDVDILVYANWIPKTYDVTFYLDYEKYLSGTSFREVTDTPHGTTMLNPPGVPSHDNKTYSFVRWVYEDEAGTKHSFEPTEMPVRQNLKLYAEWRTTQVGEYTLYYAKGQELADGTIVPYLDANGQMVYLTKKPLEGYAMVGTTKTVQALTVDQLDAIPAGEAGQLWLPQTNSHSIPMQPNAEENVFTFLYITKPDAKYKVLYLDEETGQPVHEETTGTTKNAEETLWFQYVEGYIPDALYKRLVMSADDDKNVLIFYYTKDNVEEDEENALYQVNHWIQNLDGKTFSIYTTEAYTATVGSQVTAKELTIPGFTFKNGKFTINSVDYESVKNGIVKSGEDNGANKALELNLYYLRDTTTYTVYYKNQDDANDSKMPPAETFDALVGAVVEEQAKEIPGYDLISNETQTLTVSSTAQMNQITFWYKEKDRTVYYKMICTDPYAEDFGKLTKSEDMGTQISGSQAIAMSGFYFDGWYQENTATGKLEKVSNTATFNPKNAGCIQDDVYEYTFYARFKPITLKLTHQSFRYNYRSGFYEILRQSDNALVATVSISGDNSVILEQIPVGTYIVREIGSDWTWTYDNTNSISFTVVAGENEVFLPHVIIEVDWHNGENRSNN